MILATCRLVFIIHACSYSSLNWSKWSYSFIGVTVKMAIEEMEPFAMATFFR